MEIMKTIESREEFIIIKSVDNFADYIGRESNTLFQRFQFKNAPYLQEFITKRYNSTTKSHIIYDNDQKIIIGFFVLSAASMIRSDEAESVIGAGLKSVGQTIPCMELEYFAVNDLYLQWLKEHGYSDRGVGEYIYKKYILNVLRTLTEFINFSYIILFSINHPKVVDSYRKKGFITIDDDNENIIPMLGEATVFASQIVEGCQFMFQESENIFYDEW